MQVSLHPDGLHPTSSPSALSTLNAILSLFSVGSPKSISVARIDAWNARGGHTKYIQMGYVSAVFLPVLFFQNLLISDLKAGEKGRGRHFLDTTREVDALLKPALLSRLSLVTSLFYFF